MFIKEIKDEIQKQEIASSILKDLPKWFGLDESTKEYIESVKNYPMFSAFEENQAIGFYSVREENKDVLDMYVLGVIKKYHNKGVGTLLQNYVDNYALEQGYKYLMVLTLAKKANNEEYLQTRNFYLKMNYIDFYQDDNIFDANNPCQIMMKIINNNK